MKKCSFALSVVVACLSMMVARSEDVHGLRISFPVVMDPPTVSGGAGIKPGGVVFQQPIRSAKAVRLTAEHVVSYRRSGEKSETAIKLAAGTLFVLARDKIGELYCTANASEGNALVVLLGPFVKKFHDAGICIRDTDLDGTFDQEAVVDQASQRTRIAYEISAKTPMDWQTVSLKAEQVDPSQIPASELRITYDHSSGGLFGEPRGVLHFSVWWPKSMVSTDASEGSGKWYANLNADARGEGIGFTADDGVQVTVKSRLFGFEIVMDQKDRANVTVKRAPAAGQAQLIMTGFVWQPRYEWFQRTVVDLASSETQPVPAN